MAIYAYQKRIWTLGSIALSLGIGVKMSLLLALPGAIMVLGQGSTVNRALRNVAAIVQVQVSFFALRNGEYVRGGCIGSIWLMRFI